MGKWYSDLEDMGPALMSFGIGIGFAVYFLYELAAGMGSGPGANIINSLLSGIESAITTFWPIILTAIFIGIGWVIIRKAMNSGKSGEGGGRSKN